MLATKGERTDVRRISDRISLINMGTCFKGR